MVKNIDKKLQKNMIFVISFLQGVLRQLPMIGSMVNWWSPPPKDAMKGRTFNLVSGMLDFHFYSLIFKKNHCIKTE